MGNPADGSLPDDNYAVLEAAHEAGYFGCPRRTAGTELAAALGLSPGIIQSCLRKATATYVDQCLTECDQGDD